MYFEWNDSLKGKKGFIAQDMHSLKKQVDESSDLIIELCPSHNDITPFADENNGSQYRFAYYDPNYEVKSAWIKGKVIQYLDDIKHEWKDYNLKCCGGFEYFNTEWDKFQWRIKDEDWNVVLGGLQVLGITKDPQGKHVYFKGTEDECNEWIDEHKNFVGTMIAWEEGRQIQYKNSQHSEPEWIDITLPTWEIHTEYRVKNQCEGCNKYFSCENSDRGIRCLNYAVIVDKRVPFETIDELIRKWESMNQGCKNRPSCAMPMIWIKDKNSERIYLIIGYEPNDNRPIKIDTKWYSFEDLFEYFTFLDGSAIGKRN